MVKATLRLLLLVLVIAGLWFIVARTMYYHAGDAERSTTGAGWMATGFTVAVVWPNEGGPSFPQGVGLAIEEENARKDALSGKIKMRTFTEREDLDPTQLARNVASYSDTVAVLGHELSADAIPASVTYESHGLLFIAPVSTDPRLTQHNFRYLFRMSPTDEMTVDAISHFARDRGWKRVGLLYGRQAHGESAASEFRTQALEYGIQVAFYRSYLHETHWAEQDFRPLIAEIRREQFDAILLADILPWGAKIVIDLATMGVTQPILATDKLDSPQLFEIAKAAANTVYVASAVDPNNTTPEYQGFRQRFIKRFGTPPTYSATQGFEALNMVTNAAIKSNSADPIVVSTTLRTNTWKGLFGTYSFDETGDILGRKISIKHMQNGTFVTEAIIPSEKDHAVVLTEPGN